MCLKTELCSCPYASPTGPVPIPFRPFLGPVKGSHSHWSVSRYTQPVRLCPDQLALPGGCDLTGPSSLSGTGSRPAFSLVAACTPEWPCSHPPLEVSRWPCLRCAVRSSTCARSRQTSSALSPSTADSLRAMVFLHLTIVVRLFRR